MAYIPRLSTSSPTVMQNNPWWYSSGNRFYAAGYGLPNCTCYCYGRTGEITGAFNTDLPYGDGGTWYNYIVSRGIIPVGSEPKLGAIACWYDPNGVYAGHVAQVEEISADRNTITLSNSGYPSNYFWTASVTRANNFTEQWALNRGYVLQGFIYVYNDPTPPTPPTPTNRRHLPIWMLLRYGA